MPDSKQLILQPHNIDDTRVYVDLSIPFIFAANQMSKSEDHLSGLKGTSLPN